MTPGTPDPLDVALGATVRQRRKTKGVSQSALGETIGVTFQQIQKYERGVNRISFSMLVRIAKVLECRVSELVGELDEAGDEQVEAGASAAQLLSSPQARELVERFNGVRSTAARSLNEAETKGARTN